MKNIDNNNRTWILRIITNYDHINIHNLLSHYNWIVFHKVGKAIINHPTVVTIFIGGINLPFPAMGGKLDLF